MKIMGEGTTDPDLARDVEVSDRVIDGRRSRFYAYRRDNSFYGHHGYGSKFHFLGLDLASKCGAARMLNIDGPVEASTVPQSLRCQANGCRELWSKVYHL